MPTADSRRGGVPGPRQELVLRAALLQGKASVDAWEEWRARPDLDAHLTDPSSQHLLPLLYQNLRNQGVDDRLMGKLGGLQRRAWYRNELLFDKAADLLRAVGDAGIEALVLKGAALGLLYYGNHGLRPVDSFDVLVRSEQAEAAVHLLREMGWTPRLRAPEAFTDAYLSIRSSHRFLDGEDCQLNLYWRLLPECREPGMGNRLWTDAISMHLHQVATRALSPTDQLFQVCIEGARWNPYRRLTWAADAAMLLRNPLSAESPESPTEIDWERLLAHARQCELLLPLRTTLDYLSRTLAVPVPSDVLRDLHECPISETEQREYRTKGRPTGLLGSLPELWLDYQRYVRAGNERTGFHIFLQHVWGLDHAWKLPLHVVLRGLQGIMAR